MRLKKPTITLTIDERGRATVKGPGVYGEWADAHRELEAGGVKPRFWSVLGYIQAGTGESPHGQIDHPNDYWKLAQWADGYRVGQEKWIRDQGSDPDEVLNFTQQELQAWLAAREVAGEKS